MRSLALLLVGGAVTVTAAASDGRVISAHGVRVVVPPGWHRMTEAGDGPAIDPRTLLAVGTARARPRSSQCQIAAYRVPRAGAVVVVVGWKMPTSGGTHLKPGRAPLKKLVSVTRPSFECFSGRGASAQLILRRKLYQVNVMVGDRASARRIAEALAVGRSFDLARR